MGNCVPLGASKWGLDSNLGQPGQLMQSQLLLQKPLLQASLKVQKLVTLHTMVEETTYLASQVNDVPDNCESESHHHCLPGLGHPGP